MTKFILPAIAANLLVLCTHNGGPPHEADDGTEVRLSAAVQADIEHLAGVRLKLTPSPDCESAGVEDTTVWSDELDIQRMVWPNGKAAYEGPNDYTHILAETSFIDVAPGCYDVVATPIDADGEPLLSCYGASVPITVDDYASLIVDPPIYCSAPPRSELDVQDGNFPPHLDALVTEPSASACEVVEVCATARDADDDMLVFEWPQPAGIDQGPATAPWPTIVHHQLNEDRSVTQCIAVQAHEPGAYEISVEVYDVVRPSPYGPPVHIEDLDGQPPSSAAESAALDATLGCEPTGRSAVIMLTLGNDPGLREDQAATLIDNTIEWVTHSLAAAPGVLVVLDDNHHGEDWQDGELVHATLKQLGYPADYMLEPSGGLGPADVEGYEVVWFVNPGHEMDDPGTHTTLLRYRAQGGAVVLQGDDIARFRNKAQFMEPLTYLSWQGNGTVACGVAIDNNQGDSYAVEFSSDVPGASHPLIAGLEGLRIDYGNDIDLTRPLGKGEQVVAWAEYETPTCVVRTPVIVALEPDELLPW